jgi:DNA-binding response OmpR family regulator
MIKILAVDDEPGICDILKKTFSPIGFKVLTATNGPDAISLVKKEKPKIVFLDIRMLGMSGFEVLTQIKKIDKKIKVIMVTVLGDDQTRMQAKALGADEFVTKPFLSDSLEALVSRFVSDLIQEESGHAEG